MGCVSARKAIAIYISLSSINRSQDLKTRPMMARTAKLSPKEQAAIARKAG